VGPDEGTDGEVEEDKAAPKATKMVMERRRAMSGRMIKEVGRM